MLQFDDVSRGLTVAPQGELDHCMAERIRNTIDATVLKTDAKVVVFDLSEVGFMDSSGIGMMIGRYKFMKRRGGGVRVRGMRQPVERVFRMSGLGQIIKNEERTESK